MVRDYLAEVARLVTHNDSFSTLGHIDYPVRSWPRGPGRFDSTGWALSTTFDLRPPAHVGGEVGLASGPLAGMRADPCSGSDWAPTLQLRGGGADSFSRSAARRQGVGMNTFELSLLGGHDDRELTAAVAAFVRRQHRLPKLEDLDSARVENRNT